MGLGSSRKCVRNVAEKAHLQVSRVPGSQPSSMAPSHLLLTALAGNGTPGFHM